MENKKIKDSENKSTDYAKRKEEKRQFKLGKNNESQTKTHSKR